MFEQIKGIYPGSFDPFTVGHADILMKALSVFNTIDIIVSVNYDKKHMFNSEQRAAIISKSIKDLHIPAGKVVNIIIYGGILAEYEDTCQKYKKVIIRGLRNHIDLDYEQSLEEFNSSVSPEVETCYFSATANNRQVSSSLVRNFLATNHIGNAKSVLCNGGFVQIKQYISNDKDSIISSFSKEITVHSVIEGVHCISK